MSSAALYNLTAILVAMALIWYWHDNMRARESAIASVGRFCNDHSLQFLDDSVCLRAIAFSFTHRAFRRHYDFYYTRDSHERRRGTVILMGHSVEHFLVNEDTAAM